MTKLGQIAHQAFEAAPASATWGTHVLDFETGRPLEEFENQDTAIEAASINKLGIVHALQLRGIPRSTEMSIEHDDKRGGDGVLQGLPDGYRLLVGDIERLCLSASDNTAARMLVRVIGGPLAVNNTLAESPLGLTTTALAPVNSQDISSAALYYYGQTTAVESAKLLRTALYVPEQATALQHGRHPQGLRRRFDNPRLREANLQHVVAATLAELHVRGKQGTTKLYDWLLKETAPQTAYPNKIGNYEGTKGDVAKIGRSILSVLYHDETNKWPHTAQRIAVPAQNAIGETMYRSYMANRFSEGI